MRIDLHCHTKKIKSGDGKARNVTPALFKEKIELADVKIVAITNHNAFDYQQYLSLKESVDGLCQVWPGVEIDVLGETKFHLIIVTKPDDAISFSQSVATLFEGDDLDTCHHTLDEVYQCFCGYDAIYVPHFHDKKPAISEKDKRKLMDLVKDDARVFIEPRNHRTLGVLANKDMSVLIGSDVKDWNKYESCTFAELRLPVGSFSEFLLLARRDTTVVETLLGKKTPMNMIGHPYASVKLPLTIYPDVNIIFGQKGTGKTEILKSLYTEMLGLGKNCKKYIASERGEDFSALLSIQDMELSLEKVDVDPCDSEFLALSKWTDCNPTLFSTYVNWYSTRGNSNNKSRMKITEAVHDYFDAPENYEKHKSDRKKMQQASSKIKEIYFDEYVVPEDAELLRLLLSKLSESILAKRESDLIDEYASQMTNSSIDSFKSLADRNSDTISRPSTAGLKEFALRRIELLQAVNRILKGFSAPEHNERVRLGSLDGKGDIFVNYKYRMLCSGERTKNFPGYNITVLRAIVEQLKYIRDHIFEIDISTTLEKLNTDCEDNKISSLKPFLGRSKQIVTSDGKEYAPSNGEKGILLLEQVLHDDADAYFLDEPELGMGNSYIDTDIRPLISNLAKRRKVVVVATHNANIAVRTLPYMSIFRVHENGNYKTFVGNPFDDRLVCIGDPSDIRSWTEESMHSLEGGREAFYERRDIYESRDN